MFKSEYFGWVDGVYEGWQVVIDSNDRVARVVYASEKDHEGLATICVEDRIIANGEWAMVSIVVDNIYYDLTEKKDIEMFNKCLEYVNNLIVSAFERWGWDFVGQEDEYLVFNGYKEEVNMMITKTYARYDHTEEVSYINDETFKEETILVLYVKAEGGEL